MAGRAFALEEASVEDAAAIAKVWLSAETGDFLRLQLGSVDPSILSEGMTTRMEESIRKEGQVYVVARDNDSNEIVSYAHWVLPKAGDDESGKMTAEEKADELERYRQKLLPGMNEQLLLDFKQEIDDMEVRVLQDRKHYRLGNLGTLPWYQRRGAASALIRWPFEVADREGLSVYLETDEAGNPRRMYKQLGFERKDAAVFDLSKYGGTGSHTHMAMIREPRPQEQEPTSSPNQTV